MEEVEIMIDGKKVKTISKLSKEEIDEKLEVLRNAIESEDDNVAREALRSVVPTFRRPEEINKQVA